MATLLETEYKLLASKQIYSNVVDGVTVTNTIKLYGRISKTDLVTKKTTYYLKFTFTRNKGYITVGTGTSNLNGTTQKFSNKRFEAGETILQESSFTVTHNADGTVSDKTVTASWEGSVGGSGSLSATLSFLDFPQLEIVEVKSKEATLKVSKFADKGQTITNIGWRITTDSTYSDYDRIDGELEHTFTELLPETTYYIRAYVTTNVYSLYSPWVSFTTDKNNVVRLRVNGSWKESIPYIYKNGWKEATPYINVNGTYKEVN